jgi:hypothetical protein
MTAIDYEALITATARSLHNRTRSTTEPAQRPAAWDQLTDTERHEKIRAARPYVTHAIPLIAAAAYRADAANLADPHDTYLQFLTDRLEGLAQSYDAMTEPDTNQS